MKRFLTPEEKHIKRLEEQLSSAQAEIERYKSSPTVETCRKMIEDQAVKENAALHGQLASAQAEIAQWQSMYDQLANSRDSKLENLAACQAENLKLREELNARTWKLLSEAPYGVPIISYCRKHGTLDGVREWLEKPITGRGAWIPTHWIPYPTSTIVDSDKQAISTTSDTALTEYRNGVIEECAKVCDESYPYSVGHTDMRASKNLAEAIRAMKEKP